MKDDSCELIELSHYLSKKETVRIDRNKFISNEMKQFLFKVISVDKQQFV